MRLHRTLLTAAVLAMTLAGCTDSGKRAPVNPAFYSSNPIGTTPINGTGWGTPMWGSYLTPGQGQQRNPGLGF
jgi:hypothetical protein